MDPRDDDIDFDFFADEPATTEAQSAAHRRTENAKVRTRAATNGLWTWHASTTDTRDQPYIDGNPNVSQRSVPA